MPSASVVALRSASMLTSPPRVGAGATADGFPLSLEGFRLYRLGGFVRPLHGRPSGLTLPPYWPVVAPALPACPSADVLLTIFTSVVDLDDRECTLSVQPMVERASIHARTEPAAFYCHGAGIIVHRARIRRDAYCRARANGAARKAKRGGVGRARRVVADARLIAHRLEQRRDTERPRVERCPRSDF